MREKILSIINHYKINNQLKKFAEEHYELVEAIFQYEAQKEACENVGCNILHLGKCEEHIAEEIADCYVMIEQFRLYYKIPIELIQVIMREKINRQLERISNEDKM